MLMGHELVRGDAQDAIEARARKRGMTPFLPPSVPFVSHEWVWIITPSSGPATIKAAPVSVIPRMRSRSLSQARTALSEIEERVWT